MYKTTKTNSIVAFLCSLVMLLFLLVSASDNLYAQKTKPATAPGFTQEDKDTSKPFIHILNNDYGEYIQQDGRSVQKLMHNVKLLYESDTLFCDSAFFYVQENSVEAFGDVAVFQADGTQAFADYMRYSGKNKQVYMKSYEGDVQLQDKDGNILWSKEVFYNLKTKVGNYSKDGVLQNGETLVSSKSGSYNMKTKTARFKKDVIIEDPQYYILSEDLSYNTESKIVTFHSVSTIVNDKSVLKTKSGFYNTIDSTSYFTSRSAVWNESQFIEADTLDYSHKQKGVAVARGNVIAFDTVQKVTLYSREAWFKEHSNELKAYGAPLLRAVNKSDSLYIKADTFYSAPVPKDFVINGVDSLRLQNERLRQTAEQIRKQTFSEDSLEQHKTDTLKMIIPDNATSRVRSAKDSLLTQDSISSLKMSNPVTKSHQSRADSLERNYRMRMGQKDTTDLRYFIGYYNVRIYSDSLQGYCDSIRYSQTDSLLKMYKKPLLWPSNSLVLGKEIHLKLDSNNIKELIVPEDGILINRSGPEVAEMFNQIQGGVIHGYFEESQLHQLFAEPNASSIYFVTDDAGAYIGCSEASSRQIEILFDTTGKADKIYYRQDVKQKMIPMKDVQPKEMRLERFQWIADLRPKDLESFLEGTSRPIEPIWN